MTDRNRKLNLTAYDELFRDDSERQADRQEKVQTLPRNQFYPFPNHPFHVVDDEKMADTVQSVSEHGILVPILARPRPQGGYEIVSGHRRIHAGELAGLTEVPAIIRSLDDDEATIIMVDSNLQREQLLPSEKAFAYKMKLEALAHRGKTSTCGQVGHKSRDTISDEASGRQIQRFIRLTYLIKPLLDMVDENKFALNPAVEISYLPEVQQNSLVDAIDYAQSTPSLAQARKIRAFSDSGKLDRNVMDSILAEEKPLERKVTLRNDRLQRYFPSSYTPRQMEKVIVDLLEQWSRQQKERDSGAR